MFARRIVELGGVELRIYMLGFGMCHKPLMQELYLSYEKLHSPQDEDRSVQHSCCSAIYPLQHSLADDAFVLPSYQLDLASDNWLGSPKIASVTNE